MKKLTILGILAVHLILLLNLKFTVWPEMILYPYLLNHGFKLYSDIINPYFPLLPLVESWVFNLLGAYILTLKVLTFLIILLSDLAVFYFSLKLTKNYPQALWGLIIYCLLQLTFGGVGLWFELSLVPLVVFGLALAFLYQDRRNILLSGLLLGLAVLIKQNAAFFFIPALWILFSKGVRKDLGFLILPPVVLGSLLIIWVNQLGILRDFINWTIKLPLTFSHQPGFTLFPTHKQELLMVFLIVPLFLVWRRSDKKIFWLLVLLVSLIFAFPRYEDFHLQVLVAFSAVLASMLDKKILYLVFLLPLLLFAYDFKSDFHQPDRFIDQTTLSLAVQIDEYPQVFLINTPELVYFFDNKLPPKPWATDFPWYYENTRVSDRVINYLGDHPEMDVVLGQRNGGNKYQLGNYVPDTLLSYIKYFYQPIKANGEYTVWQRKSL